MTHMAGKQWATQQNALGYNINTECRTTSAHAAAESRRFFYASSYVTGGTEKGTGEETSSISGEIAPQVLGYPPRTVLRPSLSAGYNIDTECRTTSAHATAEGRRFVCASCKVTGGAENGTGEETGSISGDVAPQVLGCPPRTVLRPSPSAADSTSYT